MRLSNKQYIDDLYESGIEIVRISHYRRFVYPQPPDILEQYKRATKTHNARQCTIAPRMAATGGCTVATVRFKGQNIRYTQPAYCSLDDNFCYRKGTREALAKAVKAARTDEDNIQLNRTLQDTTQDIRAHLAT